MINIDFLTELAKCSLFSTEIEELLKIQPQEVREAFEKQSSSEIKAMITTKDFFPNFSVVTAF